jgi:hypothetical protein
MTSYRSCLDCTAPVKFHYRDRCHVCHRRRARAALRRSCPRCGVLRHLTPSGICAGCVRAPTPPKPPKTICCERCGQQRRNVGHGLCNRCNLADSDRPFRYAEALAIRLKTAPPWWPDLVAFVAARHHPSGAVAVLRETGRLLVAEPAAGPQQLLAGCTAGTTARALETFFIGRGLALLGDERQRRAADRRRRYLDAVPESLASAVTEFTRVQLVEGQVASRRAGRRVLSDASIEMQLRVLRDLAVHLAASRPVTGWAEVTTADLDAFVAQRPQNRHQCTYVLRAFFGWARRRRLVVVDLARPLRPGRQPAFCGTVIDIATQRLLFRRWTQQTAHPHERLTGLLALLHAASNREIRGLTVGDIDGQRRTARLVGRPHPTALDPVSWQALDACLAHREAMCTLNPHVIVTGRTRTGDQPADHTYLARTMAAAGTTVASCRQTRISQLVTDLDPKVTAVALGMHDTGLVRYLADNVENDRLQRSPDL